LVVHILNDKTVLFRYISTEFGDPAYILLFNSCVKFHLKIFMHFWRYCFFLCDLPCM